MYLFEQIRYLILGDPLKLDVINNVSMVFLEYMLESIAFDCLLLICVIWIIGSLVVLVSRKRRENIDYYYYTTGSFLIFTAIMYRYSFNVIARTSNPNDSAVSYGSRNTNSALKALDSRLTPIFDAFIHSSHLIPNRSSLMKSAFEEPNLTGIMLQNELQNKEKKVTSAFENPSVLINNLPEESKKVKEEKQEKAVEKEESGESKQESSENEVNKATEVEHIDQNKKVNLKNEKKTQEKEKTGNKTTLKKNHSSAKEKKAVETSETNTRPMKSRSNTNYNQKDVDIYMKKITKTIETEHEANIKLHENTKTYKKIFKTIKEAFKEFKDEFRQFYLQATKIEKEMQSFNASIKNLEQASKEMKTDIDNVMKLQDVFQSLTTATAEETEFSLQVKNKKHKSTSTLEYTPMNPTTIFLTTYFVLHIILGLYFMIAIIFKLRYAFLLRWTTFICVGIDLVFGLYMIVYAQILDKICILGSVEGCQSTFTEGFANFAATAGLNLKSTDKNQKERLYNEINQIQVKAEIASNDLKNFLVESPVEKFHLKSMLFLSLFNKIEFVQEDFENLSNNKVEKTSFYESIAKMKRQLKNISLSLETNFEKKMVLEIYAREVAFTSFIDGEKEGLYTQVDKQLSQTENISSTQKSECEIKKRKIFELKSTADFVAFGLLIGSTIFMALIAL